MFYIWHDDGCCDNSTEDYGEAVEVAAELNEEYGDVYITNDEHEVLWPEEGGQ